MPRRRTRFRRRARSRRSRGVRGVRSRTRIAKRSHRTRRTPRRYYLTARSRPGRLRAHRRGRIFKSKGSLSQFRHGKYKITHGRRFHNMSRHLRKQIWRHEALKLNYTFTNDAPSFNPTQYTWTLNGATFNDSAYIFSADIISDLTIDTLQRLVMANPVNQSWGSGSGVTTGPGSSSQYADTLDLLAANANSTYNTLRLPTTNPNYGTHTAASTANFIPSIMAPNLPFLISFWNVRFEHRNNGLNAIWVEMWEASPRRDFASIYGLQDPAKVLYGNLPVTGTTPSQGVNSDAEYLYRLGKAGTQTAASFATTGGGSLTSVNVGATISCRPANDYSTMPKQCTYYNKWFYTNNFRKILVQPGATWTSSITIRNRWIDTIKLRTDNFSYFKSISKIYMMRAYGNVGMDTTGHQASPGRANISTTTYTNGQVMYSAVGNSKVRQYTLSTDYGNSNNTIAGISAVTGGEVDLEFGPT